MSAGNSEMKAALANVGRAVVLGLLATIVWLLLSPATEVGAAGRLSDLTANRGTSNDALAHMWRLQLPGTALASCIFSLLVLRASRAGYLKWSRGGAYGAALGGSLALLVFTCPPPGAPFYVWAATFYLSGLWVAALIEALPASLPRIHSSGSRACCPSGPLW